MRLSLRTLLAFEDNVFDVEQHRRLEQILHTDRAAAAVIQRMRYVVRNPMLGVPGLVDHQEELDPNYVAEYLDHQMPNNVQDEFESYCLSADKYLAEIASVHHVLSNVLGEPARTSRDCRLKCYDALTTENRNSDNQTACGDIAACPPGIHSQGKHFRPYDAPQESNGPQEVKPSANRLHAIWNLLFPAKVQAGKAEKQMTGGHPAEQKSSLWTFSIIGMLACVLLLGWQQIEKQRLAKKLHETAEAQTLVTEDSTEKSSAEKSIGERNIDGIVSPVGDSPYFVDQLSEAAEAPVPIEQAVFLTEQSSVPSSVEQHKTSIESPAADPFAVVAASLPADTMLADTKSVPSGSDSKRDMTDEEITNALPGRETPIRETSLTKESLSGLDDSIIAFQAIKPTAKIPLDVSHRQNNARSPLPISAWQSREETVLPVASVSSASSVSPVASVPPFSTPVQHAVQNPKLATAPNPQPLIQASAGQPAGAVVPRVLGTAEPMGQPSLIFTAPTSRDSWQLPPLPFDLNGGQYLLTAAPFCGTLDLAVGVRIEMIGDSKLCILPLDISGVPGIFVDYGRIVIHPLKPNQSLRIETARSRGIVRITGTESALFIDTFAEISDPQNAAKPPEKRQKKTAPILGFVPKNGENIIWQSSNQQQPLLIDSQGSVLLQSDQCRFGEIPNLPNWLGAMQMSPENRMLAEACRRCFSEANGNGEQALTWLIQNDSRTIRTLGLRLWGDLGRFDIPLAVLEEGRQEEEAIILVMRKYFREVMLRDEESIHRLSDAIDTIKEARK